MMSWRIRPNHFRFVSKKNGIKHVVEGVVQMPPEQAQDISRLARKPVPVFDHPHSEYMFPTAKSDPPLMQFCAITLHPAIDSQEQSLAPCSVSSPQAAAESRDHLSVSSSLDSPVSSASPHLGHAFQHCCQLWYPPLYAIIDLTYIKKEGNNPTVCTYSITFCYREE